MEQKNNKKKIVRTILWCSILLIVFRYFFPRQRKRRTHISGGADE